MKAKLQSLIAALALVPVVGGGQEQAREIVMEWDPNPPEDNVTEYWVYVDRTDNGVDDFEILKRVAISPEDPHETTLDGMEGAGLFRTRLTAFNGLESEPSEVVTVQPFPSRPGGYRIKVNVSVEVSTE